MDRQNESRRGFSQRISNITPFICGLVIFKTTVDYYYWLFPSVESISSILYQIITLFCFSLFPLMLIQFFLRQKNYNWKLMRPIILIPLAVIVNIIMVMFQQGSIEVISRNFVIVNAASTNDYTGYYFAAINTWFGNIGLLLFLMYFVNNKRLLKKCIIASLVMFVLPIIFVLLMHPEYIGLRESQVSDMVFGGGIWNIGVCGFGSLAWLAISQLYDVNKKQKYIILFSILLFSFAGISGLSRTFVLMIFFSLTYFIIFTRKNKTWMKTLFITIAFISVFLMFEGSIASQVVGRFNDSATGGTSNVRFALWGNYIKYIDEYFWLGAPVGSVYNYYHDTNLLGKHFLPHSSILNFWIRFGAFAVLGYLIMIKNAATKLKKRNDVIKKYKRVCLQAWVVSYISLSFINQTGFAEIAFYLGFGLIFALINIENSEVLPM